MQGFLIIENGYEGIERIFGICETLEEAENFKSLLLEKAMPHINNKENYFKEVSKLYETDLDASEIELGEDEAAAEFPFDRDLGFIDPDSIRIRPVGPPTMEVHSW